MDRKEKFLPGEYYHIYCRTILNIPEFKDFKNAERLSQAFLLANSTNSSHAFSYLRKSKSATMKNAVEIAQGGEKIVDVVCYSIMPNHYHLLLKEVKDGGITEFIRKCNTSIAKYINIKNERKGSLFESKFKSRHVNSNEYLTHLSVYINLNPLDFISGKEWRTGKLKDWEKNKKELLNYDWSSAKYFLTNIDDKIISGAEIILEQFKNKGDYEKFLQNWSIDYLDNKIS